MPPRSRSTGRPPVHRSRRSGGGTTARMPFAVETRPLPPGVGSAGCRAVGADRLGGGSESAVPSGWTPAESPDVEKPLQPRSCSLSAHPGALRIEQPVARALLGDGAQLRLDRPRPPPDRRPAGARGGADEGGDPADRRDGSSPGSSNPRAVSLDVDEARALPRVHGGRTPGRGRRADLRVRVQGARDLVAGGPRPAERRARRDSACARRRVSPPAPGRAAGATRPRAAASPADLAAPTSSRAGIPAAAPLIRVSRVVGPTARPRRVLVRSVLTPSTVRQQDRP